MVLENSKARERRQDELSDSSRNQHQLLTTIVTLPVPSDIDAARDRYSAAEPPIPTRALHDAPDAGSGEATLRLAIGEYDSIVDKADFVHAVNLTTALTDGIRSNEQDYEESSYSNSMA